MTEPNNLPRTRRRAAPAPVTALPEPVFLEGEDPELYRRLAERVREAVQPTDIIEEFWVRDIIDLEWDTIRYRRLKASMINSNLHRGMASVLEPVHPMFADDFAEELARRSPAAVESNRRRLAEAGRTMEDVLAATMELKLPELERINDLIASAESRRSAIIREFDRRRSSAAQMLRTAITQIEEAEFRELGTARGQRSPP